MSKRPPSAHERPSTISQALEKAILAVRTQRPAEAERLASRVLKSNRDHLLAAQILGEALLLQDRPEEAVDVLRRAARHGSDPAAETLLGMALAAVGRSEEALDQLRLATTRRPPFLLAFLQLGDRLGDIGGFGEGIAVLESGLALMPGAEVLRLALGYLHLKRNDRAEARALFSQVLAAGLGRPNALVGLARVMALDGEYEEAADLYRRVLATRPDDAVTRIALAKCLLETGDRQAGEAALRAAARGDAGLARRAISALAATPHGRFFLRPSAAAKFLGAETK
ncbi:MAG TPA: tetratricopeptide repeat protein [Caulobacteraceae bacterium]|nr:tetratricopeptide repeat protein [Caulobacteraceae bacterium]